MIKFNGSQMGVKWEFMTLFLHEKMRVFAVAKTSAIMLLAT